MIPGSTTKPETSCSWCARPARSDSTRATFASFNAMSAISWRPFAGSTIKPPRRMTSNSRSMSSPSRVQVPTLPTVTARSSALQQVRPDRSAIDHQLDWATAWPQVDQLWCTQRSSGALLPEQRAEPDYYRPGTATRRNGDRCPRAPSDFCQACGAGSTHDPAPKPSGCVCGYRTRVMVTYKFR